MFSYSLLRHSPLHLQSLTTRLSMDQSTQLLLLILIYWYMRRTQARRNKRLRESSLIFPECVATLDVLASANRQCMSRDAHAHISNHFREKGWLEDSRHVSVEQKMKIFLTAIGSHEGHLLAESVFERCLRSYRKCFKEVLDAMMKFATEIVVPTTFDPNLDVLGPSCALRRIFKGAVGVLDGLLVNAIPPTGKEVVYRVKGRYYQKVLGICDFDMVFTFVWAGWEGIVHDLRVLRDVVPDSRNNFPFPPSDKYYLCDKEYVNTRGFMTPYDSGRQSTKKEKMFNHAHAKLRNVIERAYAVLKARFPILTQMAPYSFAIQRNIVIACFAIHNYIRKEGIADELFELYDQPEMDYVGKNGHDGEEKAYKQSEIVIVHNVQEEMNEQTGAEFVDENEPDEQDEMYYQSETESVAKNDDREEEAKCEAFMPYLDAEKQQFMANIRDEIAFQLIQPNGTS